jgi:hypothetical protein
MGLGKSLIYVRPAKDRRTVELVADLAAQAGYKFVLVTLVAEYGTLCRRVSEREQSEFRVRDKAGLDEYLTRPTQPPDEEIGQGWVISTEHRDGRAVADLVQDILEAARWNGLQTG